MNIRFAPIILLAVCLFACSDFNTNKMFAAHATQATDGELKNLRGGHVSCLHCPMYFTFDAAPTLVERIIVAHQLKQAGSLPAAAEELLELVQRDASWWQLAELNAHDKIYWIHYSPKSVGLEPAFRLLVLRDGKAFFITSGHFVSESYLRDTA